MGIEILILIGILCGIAAGFFGIGGGIILVPCLLFYGMDMEYAIGVSIMQMIFSSTFGSIINIYQKKLDVKQSIYVALGGLIGASFSGTIVNYLSSQTLLLLFLLLSCISFYKYAFNLKTQTNPSPPITNPVKQKILMIIAGSITGIFAVSLGIGGGLILAPMLAYFLGFSSKKIVPVSLFFIIFASLSGSISLATHNLIDFQSGLIIGISSIIGVSFGIYLISKVTLSNHRYALITIYALSIVSTSWKVAQGFDII